MSPFEDAPLSGIDAEIEVLLRRLAALEVRAPDEREHSIREIAIAAIKERLRILSRTCTDKTCRIRVLEEVRRHVGPPSDEAPPAADPEPPAPPPEAEG